MKAIFNDPRKRKIAIFSCAGLIGLCLLCGIVSVLFSPKTGDKTAATTSPVVAAAETELPAKKDPTATPKPTNTKMPSKTPRPTNTPSPIPTDTPVPQPIEFTGAGNQIVDFDNPFGPAFIHATYQGSSNFIIYNLDENNEEMDLLVNTIGNYDGFRPLDFADDDHTKRFKIDAEGQWKIIVYPLSEQYLNGCVIPGGCDGNGDNLLLLKGQNPDTFTYKFDGESNAIVYSYSSNGADLLVNEIAPITGSTILSKGTFLIEVQAEGPWYFIITTK